MSVFRSRIFRTSVLVIVIMLLTFGTAAALTQPINRIVVIVDNSGSFRSRYGEAIRKAVELLNDLSQAARGSGSEVFVITLDAIPEAIWSGTTEELMSIKSSFWTSRFNSRKDYSQCTDVTAAFKLAAQHLSGSRSDRRIVIAFSDLTHEPAGSSINKPKSRSIMPPKDFPWGSFRDGTSVSVYWIPASHKLHWQRAAQKHGLSDFRLYTPSESAGVAIKPPPRAKREYTPEEIEVAGDRYRRLIKYILGTVGMFVGVSIALPVIAVLLLRRRRNRLGQNAGNPNRVIASRNPNR